MKRYTSSQMRERFADMLDAAERGEEVIWLHHDPDRASALARGGGRLYVSPATALELQFHVEL